MKNINIKVQLKEKDLHVYRTFDFPLSLVQDLLSSNGLSRQLLKTGSMEVSINMNYLCIKTDIRTHYFNRCEAELSLKEALVKEGIDIKAVS